LHFIILLQTQKRKVATSAARWQYEKPDHSSHQSSAIIEEHLFSNPMMSPLDQFINTRNFIHHNSWVWSIPTAVADCSLKTYQTCINHQHRTTTQRQIKNTQRETN